MWHTSSGDRFRPGSYFDEYAKEFKKITPEKPYFMLEKNAVFLIIMCVRNNLITNDFIYDKNNFVEVT